ncbi:hypothetical protein QMK19_07175 [Streptomyces sp. H10-C2]|uniref:hypothetical protein n=1 Tax=unclassified Streptomyces TaxID=2593676 RepID=UPI0024B9E079|nr:MULTISPECIES: hypothetical protein [unclassified Streptomyces]MDJ0341188.1 hypothetical protein [Streptomyces sp. PH10-H1]MDJ0369459.1 hypothetical protein [Streptomyces sp. H10-C2]
MGEPGEVLDIKTADIKVSAPVFHTQSENLRLAAAALKTALDGLGAPWGGDDEVAKFREGYTKNRTSIESSAAILVEGLASIHTALTDMADGHIDNDELIKAMFSKAGRKDAH